MRRGLGRRQQGETAQRHGGERQAETRNRGRPPGPDDDASGQRRAADDAYGKRQQQQPRLGRVGMQGELKIDRQVEDHREHRRREAQDRQDGVAHGRQAQQLDRKKGSLGAPLRHDERGAEHKRRRDQGPCTTRAAFRANSVGTSPQASDPVAKTRSTTRAHLAPSEAVVEPAVERHHDDRREQVGDRQPRGLAQAAELAADDRRRRGEQGLVDRRQEHRQHDREEQLAESRPVEPGRRHSLRDNRIDGSGARKRRRRELRAVLSAAHARPVEPNPPAPRSLAPNHSTTRKLACTTGTITIWAMRSKGCTV